MLAVDDRLGKAFCDSHPRFWQACFQPYEISVSAEKEQRSAMR